MGFGWVTKALFCTRCGLYDETRVCIGEMSKRRMLTFTALECCRMIIQYCWSDAYSEVVQVWTTSACIGLLTEL